MDGLLQTLIPLLAGDTLGGISEQLGVDKNKTQQAYYCGSASVDWCAQP